MCVLLETNGVLQFYANASRQSGNKTRYSDAWKRWNTSLEMLSRLNTRTVLRITLIKDYNTSDELIPKFAQMFKRANVHFVEAKSYMHVGRSTNRLEYSNTLEM